MTFWSNQPLAWSTGRVLEKMRESFQLELEGADMRAVAGVLYELYYRSMVNSWPPYVFAEGVDIDFISKVKEQGLSGVEIEAATVRTYINSRNECASFVT